MANNLETAVKSRIGRGKLLKAIDYTIRKCGKVEVLVILRSKIIKSKDAFFLYEFISFDELLKIQEECESRLLSFVKGK